MVGDLWQRGTSRLSGLQSVAQITGDAVELIRTRRIHAVAAAAAGVAIVAVGFATVGYVQHTRHVAEAQLTASRIEAANVDLQDELARLRDKVAINGRDLAAAQGRVAALAEEIKAHAQQPQPAAAEPKTPVKGDKVTQLTSALHLAEAQRATLAARLSKAEADLGEQQAKQTELFGQIEQWQKKLEQMSTDRDRLKARVGELEKQSQLRHAQQPIVAAAPLAAPPATAPPAVAPAPVAAAVPAPVAAAAPAPAPPPQPAAVPPRAAANEPAVDHGVVDQFARVLASAGVDVRQLFAQFGVNQNQGGPFIPVQGQVPKTTLSPEKLAALRAMIKSLPVAAPLESFEVSSPFGVREDPENGHAGFHTGIDLRAPYDSPVYATAPGVVTFAAYRNDYGKIVEIDHGNGITTRYAHLHAFTVSVGQRVAAHTQIGYLGSTGRATGPHVHYEVVVNGEPQDPEKFFGLARYVPAMTVPVSTR